MRIGRYFEAHEMRCRGWENRPRRRCCCHGAMKWSDELIAALDLIREGVYRGPLIPLNGFRCEAYNESVHGHARSYHLEGGAADLRMVEGRDAAGQTMEEVANEIGERIADLITHGSGNVIWYPDRHFIHVDIGVTNGKIVRVKTAPPNIAGRH